jgi:hypothetical protein
MIESGGKCESDSRPERLSGCRANSSGMHSHWPGPDGFRIRHSALAQAVAMAFFLALVGLARAIYLVSVSRRYL